ncbi:MAG: hypothetical protein J1E83_12660 [Lachnospiraceae bacterium]|nr:hypothetical protein [Lachnospiraceae bacterium]
MSTLFTDVMTVFNYGRDETGKEYWNRSFVQGVQWQHNRKEVIVTQNVQTISRVESITVDFRKSYGRKPYLPYPDYTQLPDEKKKGYWSLGDDKDILVLGQCDMELHEAKDIKRLKESFSTVVSVMAISDNRNRLRLKNIKVVAK